MSLVEHGQTGPQRIFLLRLKPVPCPTPGRQHLGDCWEFDGARDDDNYGKIKRDGKTLRANRYAFELFHRPLQEGEVVLHECDNPPCCRPSHVRAGSQHENCQDKVRKGRQVNVSVIPPEDIPKIREALSRDPRSTGKLAKKYGCSVSTIKAISAGQNWALDMRRKIG